MCHLDWDSVRSSTSDRLAPSYNLATVGRQAFLVSTANLWNSLPAHHTSAPLLTVVRQRLKTFLFWRSDTDLIISDTLTLHSAVHLAVTTLWLKKPFYNSNNSVDPKCTWTIFCRNTARGICNLLLCTFSYYLMMQLGTSLCCHGNWFEEAPSTGTHGGKLHRAWFVRKKLLRHFLRWLLTSFSSSMTKFSR